MCVVLEWYYNERDGRPVFPELSGVYGPFADNETAKAWIEKQSTWGGWGPLEFRVEQLHKPTEAEVDL